VVLVQSTFKLTEHATTWAFGLFGLGSMLSAFILPKVLDKFNDRTVMLTGTTILTIGCSLAIYSFLCLVIGIVVYFRCGYSVAQTPTGRLIRKSASSENRTALFAAQFAFSHACWLITYPLVGWLSTNVGTLQTFIPMAVIAVISLILAMRVWSAQDEMYLAHNHDDLPPEHEHLQHLVNGIHIHEYVIDDYHQKWPK
jgi:MFS family permease